MLAEPTWGGPPGGAQAALGPRLRVQSAPRFLQAVRFL